MDFKLLTVFFTAILYNSLCSAELRDPTKPAYYSPETTIDHRIEELRLSSIWISDLSRRATINGVIAKQGDTIFSGIKIIKIYNNSVKVQQNGITRKLTLLPHSFKTK